MDTSSRLAACAIVCVLVLLGGCQTYERAPLDVPAHQRALSLRLTEAEPLTSFVARLNERGHPAPDRFDPTDGLDAAEAEVLALFYNPELRLARLRAGISLASADNAGLWEDPVFGFDGAEILSPDGPFEFGLMVNLTIPISGRLSVEKDRARSQYEVELRRIVDAEWNIRWLVREAWARWVTTLERQRLLDGTLDQLTRVGSIIDHLELADVITRVGARAIRAQMTSLQAEALRVEGEVERTRLLVLELLGLPPEIDADLVEGMPLDAAERAEGSASRLLTHNTILATRRAEYQVAEDTLRLEIRKQYPDLTIGAGYGNEDDDRLLLGVSLPIPSLNANRKEIAEARAERDLARAIAETTFESLSHELARAEAALDAVAQGRAAYESTLVPMLEDQSRELARLVDLGEVDTVLLLETIRGQYDAKATLLDLRLEAALARIAVARLLGPDDALSPAPIRNDDTSEEADL